MEIVSEGSLESISRPASTSKRSSSRSSVRSASSSVQNSLDILPPEESSLNWLTNFQVEEDIVVTDVTEDGSSNNEQTERKQDLSDQVSLQAKAEQSSDKTTSSSLDSVEKAGLSEENILNLSSVKEETCKTISPVKTEKSENSIEKIEESNVTDIHDEPHSDEVESENNSTVRTDLNDLDPKIRKGMERIKKLDNILNEKVQREKEVKKQRRDQEQLWREQLDLLEKNRDVELGKPVDLGPAHMLALGAPNETEDNVSEDSSPPVTPLFATQPLVDEERIQRQQRHDETLFETRECSGERKGGGDDLAEENKDKTKHVKDSEEKVKNINKKKKKDRKIKKKDFIKRNILLAADASNMVAMTEDEKKRLEEILSDMGDLMEETVPNDSLILYGNGFVPSQEEIKHLEDIDARLQSLMPSEEYIALSEQTEHDKQSVQSVTPRSENSSFLSEEDIPTFGELVLQEKKEMREMKQRLMEIEEQLQRFQNEDHNEGILSESLLRQLIDDNSRTTSQATTILDSISSTSYDTTSSFDKTSVISSVASTPRSEQ